jgi:hypothetical protein
LTQVATLMQLDKGAQALRALPRERQVHHLDDLAIAQIQTRRLEEAPSALLGAQEIHCRPRIIIARLTEATLARGTRALAERSGVTP